MGAADLTRNFVCGQSAVNLPRLALAPNPVPRKLCKSRAQHGHEGSIVGTKLCHALPAHENARVGETG